MPGGGRENLNGMMSSADCSADYEGYPVLFILARDHLDTLKTLSMSAIESITEIGLCAPVTADGPDFGKSALYQLTHPDTVGGIEFLNNYPCLPKHISKKALKRPVPAEKGRYPLSNLLLHEEGCEFLKKIPYFVSLLAPKDIFHLACQDSGIMQFSQDYFIKQLTPEMFLPDCEDDNLCKLLATVFLEDQWLAIFAKRPDILISLAQEKYKARALKLFNTFPFKFDSPLLSLVFYYYSKCFTLFPGLIDLISKEGFNAANSQGLSVLYFMSIFREGVEIFQKHPALFSYVTVDGVLQTAQPCDYKGLSPLYWFLAFEDNRKLIETHPNFKDMIALKELCLQSPILLNHYMRHYGMKSQDENLRYFYDHGTPEVKEWVIYRKVRTIACLIPLAACDNTDSFTKKIYEHPSFLQEASDKDPQSKIAIEEAYQIYKDHKNDYSRYILKKIWDVLERIGKDLSAAKEDDRKMYNHFENLLNPDKKCTFSDIAYLSTNFIRECQTGSYKHAGFSPFIKTYTCQHLGNDLVEYISTLKKGEHYIYDGGEFAEFKVAAFLGLSTKDHPRWRDYGINLCIFSKHFQAYRKTVGGQNTLKKLPVKRDVKATVFEGQDGNPRRPKRQLTM